MRRSAVLLAAVIIESVAALGQQPGRFSDPGSLARELRRVDAEILAGHGAQVAAGLPEEWQIEVGGRQYSISTEPLQRFIASPDQAHEWLQGIAGQLESFESAGVSPSARKNLNGILARREFAGERPLSPWQILQRRIAGWINGLLRSLIQAAGGYPVIGRLLFRVLGVAAAGVLVFWLLRLRVAKTRPTDLTSELELSQSSGEWLRTARQAADRGDLRGAVHACYWAAIVHLQDNRVLPADFTRTPREYLDHLAKREMQYTPLADLTSKLERFWYASRDVQQRDFEEALRDLETLGCPAE